MVYGLGFSGMGPGSLILILLIVVVIFGTKRFRNAGGDLGGAIKNFKESMKSGENAATTKDAKKEVIEGAKDEAIDVASKVKDTTKS